MRPATSGRKPLTSFGFSAEELWDPPTLPKKRVLTGHTNPLGNVCWLKCSQETCHVLPIAATISQTFQVLLLRDDNAKKKKRKKLLWSESGRFPSKFRTNSGKPFFTKARTPQKVPSDTTSSKQKSFQSSLTKSLHVAPKISIPCFTTLARLVLWH